MQFLTASPSLPGWVSPIRTMVAEGDDHLRSLMCWTLRDDRRFEVVGEARGADDPACYSNPFDVALVDLAVSGLGGSGLIARLFARNPAALVAVLANTEAVYLRHAARAEGAAAYFVVPDDLPDLPDRLADLADARRRLPSPPGTL